MNAYMRIAPSDYDAATKEPRAWLLVMVDDTNTVHRAFASLERAMIFAGEVAIYRLGMQRVDWDLTLPGGWYVAEFNRGCQTGNTGDRLNPSTKRRNPP